MGCVQAKPSNSPPRSLEKLKIVHGYVSGSTSSGVRPRLRLMAPETVPEPEKSSPYPPLSPPPSPPQLPPLRQIGTGDDELIDGWPRWLLNNVPKGVLTGLVPKSADSYVKIDKVGQGTYSNVYKARDRDTGKIVALKKVRFDTEESESVKFMAREIMIMQKLDHPNVLKLEGIATSRMHYSIYLVFNFMQSDLSKIIARSGKKLTETQIKCYMHQLLSGLRHCHERGILHRDIKGSNLLVDKDGVLKIGDFGLANYFIPKPKRSLTNRVVTLWYRAPELLLGSTNYGVGIDLWSAGCLLAEMFLGRPIMPGRTEVEQIHRIFKLCGSPHGDYWRKLKLSSNFRPPQPYKPTMMEVLKDLPTSSQNLIVILLALDPCNRGTAASSLQSEFFSTEPLACDLSALPILLNKEDDATDMRQKKGVSSGPLKKHPDEILDPRKQDQLMGLSKIEKPELSVHHEQNNKITDSILSGMKAIENDSCPLITSSPSSLKPDSSPIERPKNVAHHHGFEKRSISTSGASRYSEDLIPDYFAPLDDGNINEKQSNHLFGLQKRSNSTSDFISFSAEWRPKYTTVE